jgi:murein DD-endopeptidase MepM/ murein hydrolase activator NlpD
VVTSRENTERRFLILLFLLLALVPLALLGLGPDAGVAHGQEGDARVTGEGQAAFPPTVGEAGVPGCRFQVDAFKNQAGSGGSFTCELPDQSVSLGFPFRSVYVEVTGLDAPSADEATLQGPALVQVPDGGLIQDVPASILLHAGGPGSGKIHIHLQGVFDGRPGDETPGDGDYSLVTQNVTEGSIDIQLAGPSPSPSTSPTGSPGPTPSPTGSPTPSPTSSPSPHPSPTSSHPPAPGPGTPPPSPPIGDGPFTLGGTHSTARLMAILSELSADGNPRLDDVLSVVGPFPVAGLAWWQNDWHAFRCCPFPHLHQGLDMFAPRGTPVVAADDGYISRKLDGPISGMAVEITNAGGTQYFYAHLSGFGPGIDIGTLVHVGQVVGFIGNTGNASRTITHLHFEIQPNGVPVPPMPIVDAWLGVSEQRALALTERRTGRTFSLSDSATIRLWIAKALELAGHGSAQEIGDESAMRGGPRRAAFFDLRPSGPLAGFAAGALFIMILMPAVLTGLRDARRGRRWGGGPGPRPAAGAEGPVGERETVDEQPDPGGLGRHRPAAR